MDTLIVKIIPNGTANPPDKLADAELHFTGGILNGLKLIGFAVWERGVWARRPPQRRIVTFPSRQYSVNGEQRRFSLLRQIEAGMTTDHVRDLILDAYAEYEAAQVHEVPK